MKYLPDVLLVLALFASSFFFFGDALFPPEDQMMNGLDLYAFHYPLDDFAFQAFREGKLPLWNPYLLLGYPQFAESQLSTFYPLMWLAALLPSNTVSIDLTHAIPALQGRSRRSGLEYS